MLPIFRIIKFGHFSGRARSFVVLPISDFIGAMSSHVELHGWHMIRMKGGETILAYETLKPNHGAHDGLNALHSFEWS